MTTTRTIVKNMHGHTLEVLGVAIVSGRYPVGRALPPEPQLGEELGVSRTVVREAVKSLVAKGLVVTGPKVGTKVQPAESWNWFDPDVVAWQAKAGLTREFLRDLHDLRRVIEPAAARLAAERATPADVAEMEQAFAGMVKAVEEGGDYVTSDLRFHQGLLRASHNRMVAQMGMALGALLRTSFEVSTSKPHSAAESLSLHHAILLAVVAGDGARAERASRTLIDSAAADIDAVLASRRKLPSVSKQPTPLARGAARTRA